MSSPEPTQPLPYPGPPPGPPGPGPAAPPRARRRWLHYVAYPLVLIAGVGIGSSSGSGSDGTTTIKDAGSAGRATTTATGPVVRAATTTKAAVAVTAKVAAKAGPGIGDKVRDGKFSFTVTKIRQGVEQIGDNSFGVKAQGQFLLVYVTVTNIGDSARTFDGGNQTLFDAAGKKYSSDGAAAIYLDNSDSFINDINPGNTVHGIVVFDVPKSMVPAKIELHDSLFSGGVDVALK